jgi:hypothetical protein
MATWHPKKLLVEGQDDKRVIPQLMEANGVINLWEFFYGEWGVKALDFLCRPLPLFVQERLCVQSQSRSSPFFKDKFRLFITHLTPTKDMLGLRQEIRTEARQAMDKAQREYYLRQQLKAIQQELGEAETSRTVAEDYRQKIAAAKLPEDARHEARRELARLQNLITAGP